MWHVTEWDEPDSGTIAFMVTPDRGDSVVASTDDGVNFTVTTMTGSLVANAVKAVVVATVHRYTFTRAYFGGK